MALSTIEHYLSYHIRLLSPRILSNRISFKLAYIFSLIAAVTSGFVSLISLYTAAWQQQLHYSTQQVSAIASVTTLCMYLTPPFLGIIADIHGPITLNFIAILGFVPCYSYLANDFDYKVNFKANNTVIPENFKAVLVCFGIIGISTSAMYFSAFLTCAKLYPKRKLLSISLPTTFFGLSSLIGSQLLQNDWFWNADKTYLNLSKVFHFLTFSYIVVGSLTWFATGVLTLLHDHKENEDDETQSILSIPDSFERQTRMKLSQKSFFKDPVTYLLIFSVALTLGPLETFVANMAMVTNLLTINKPASSLPSDVLSTYSFFSTIIRIITGLLTEFFAKQKISPKHTLFCYILLAGITQNYIEILAWRSDGTTGSVPVLIMATFSGIAYGGLFTIYPTMLLTVYGEELFGTVYGSIMVAPALGSTANYYIAGQIFDSRCSTQDDPLGNCISPFYENTSRQLRYGLLITLYIVHCWEKRNAKMV